MSIPNWNHFGNHWISKRENAEHLSAELNTYEECKGRPDGLAHLPLRLTGPKTKGSFDMVDD
eukprot:1957018-Amphidinium_carterae.1